jgi:RimJ/RimL family protein N-acetyltransferase
VRTWWPMRVVYHPAVQRDVNRVLRRYDQISPRLGDAFWVPRNSNPVHRLRMVRRTRTSDRLPTLPSRWLCVNFALADMHTSGASLLPRPFSGGVVRRMRQSDLLAFQAYRSIPEVGRYHGWSAMSDADALAFLTQMESAWLFQPGQWVQLAIAEPTGQGLIGDIGLHLSADGQTGEVGFTLAPAAQGRGIATAAVREALHLFFAATTIASVTGVTDARNAPSIRLLERLGFKCSDTRNALFRGQECTELVYVLPRTVAPACLIRDVRHE